MYLDHPVCTHKNGGVAYYLSAVIMFLWHVECLGVYVYILLILNTAILFQVGVQ